MLSFQIKKESIMSANISKSFNNVPEPIMANILSFLDYSSAQAFKNALENGSKKDKQVATIFAKSQIWKMLQRIAPHHKKEVSAVTYPEAYYRDFKQEALNAVYLR